MTSKLPIKSFLNSFLPTPMQVNAKEQWRALLGAALGILATGILSYWFSGDNTAAIWLIAPIGASAILIFIVPASPMAQPWSVVGGNTISALAGITCAVYIHNPLIAAPISVGLAIGLMFQLRCLHPPGGATALLVVLTQASNYQFALFPVLTNSILLVLTGVAYNHVTGRAYPHVQINKPNLIQDDSRFSAADLDIALLHYNQVIDVSRDDLADILHFAESAAYSRKLGDLRCSDIMSVKPHSVQFGTALGDAWLLMRQHQLKALTVVDRTNRIAGIITTADFFGQIDLQEPSTIAGRMRTFLQKSGASHSDKPEVVGQIMTRKVLVASAQRHMIELVPLFSQGGHQQIPIIDKDKRFVGIVSQYDLLRALYQAVKPSTNQSY
jgi:CBS domain-containing membrane protein